MTARQAAWALSILTFAADGAGKPIVLLCSGKHGDSGPLSDRYRKTDNAAILRELTRAAMGVGHA